MLLHVCFECTMSSKTFSTHYYHITIWPHTLSLDCSLCAHQQLCPVGRGVPATVGQSSRPHLVTLSPLHTITPLTTRSLVTFGLTSPSHVLSHLQFTDSRLKIDDPWASGSEEGDIPDGPQRNLSHGGLGVSGINLREAMAKAKLPPIKKAEDEVEGQTSPEPCPLVGVASHGQQDVDDMLSDWDDEKDESTCKPHPSPLAASSAHIPAVVGASREPSALQHGRVGMSGGGEVGGSEGGRDDRVGPLGGTITARAAILERSNVNGEIETELEDGSSLSSEPESDIPLFGGYSPSTQTITHSSLPRLPPISQGSPPHSETPAATPPLQRMQLSTPSPTPTSPTVVTPLPLTTGASISPLHAV